ncbi:unnamed protein product [Linum tenue]|uniref:Uncharacterized protein n=2 Tax=Linum tenue TaxID=586396 RepID=A0AAV0IBY0_9ROSI|nr:unnamed protein product [Linum tenue]
MKVNILKTTIVRPSDKDEANPDHHGRRRLWLSNLDLVHGRVHESTVYLYKPSERNYFDLELLKEALSRALVPFHPLAGRLARDEKGRIEVDCNGEGVSFLEAESDASLDELGEFMPGDELLKLVPRVDYSNHEISSCPLVLLQVTRFKCGGLSLGTAIHHSVADGESALSFIKTWSNLARGLPAAVTPFMDHTILRARNPPTPKFHHSEYDPAPTLINNPNQPGNRTTMAIFRFEPDQLNALKKLANPTGTASKIRYEYFTLLSHIWRCASKARGGLAPDQPTRLHMAVDGRSRLTSPPVPSSYFGNVIFHAAPVATVGELTTEPLVRTLERIRDAIDKMDDSYLRSAIDYLEDPDDGDDPASVMQVGGTCRSPNLKIVSWVRLPLECADFGFGKPLCCRPAGLFEGYGNLLPGSGEDGSLVLAICLEAEAMAAFRKLVHGVDV